MYVPAWCQLQQYPCYEGAVGFFEDPFSSQTHQLLSIPSYGFHGEVVCYDLAPAYDVFPDYFSRGESYNGEYLQETPSSFFEEMNPEETSSSFFLELPSQETTPLQSSNDPVTSEGFIPSQEEVDLWNSLWREKAIVQCESLGIKFQCTETLCYICSLPVRLEELHRMDFDPCLIIPTVAGGMYGMDNMCIVCVFCHTHRPRDIAACDMAIIAGYTSHNSLAIFEGKEVPTQDIFYHSYLHTAWCQGSGRLTRRQMQLLKHRKQKVLFRDDGVVVTLE